MSKRSLVKALQEELSQRNSVVRFCIFGSMKVLLEIPDHKASSLMDVLNSIPYVKTKRIKEPKEILIVEIKEAVEELNLIKQGKLKGIPARQMLDDL